MGAGRGSREVCFELISRLKVRFLHGSLFEARALNPSPLAHFRAPVEFLPASGPGVVRGPDSSSSFQFSVSRAKGGRPTADLRLAPNGSSDAADVAPARGAE